MTKTTFWSIGDLHLSFAKPRDFSQFGNVWHEHTQKLERNWRECVAPQDVVLLAGDTSWATSFARFKPDLEWLEDLPGRKVLVRGNHDLWWRDVHKVRKQYLPKNFYVLQGDCLEIDGVLLCGAQGHIAPNDPYYVPDPPKNRFEREMKSLSSALENAAKARSPGQPLVIMMHYPPFTSDGQPTPYSVMIEKLAPAYCIYGHLHKPDEWQTAVSGFRNGINYALLAADYLEMMPQRLNLDIPELIEG